MLPTFICGWDGKALKARVAFGAPDQEALAPPESALEQRYATVKQRVILGQPLISYENPHISEADRGALHEAVAAALARCTPLPISDALGGIIAGHPIHVKLGEGWKRKKERRQFHPKDRVGRVLRRVLQIVLDV
jgi:hypothetical protein